jgi:hypothetical protein
MDDVARMMVEAVQSAERGEYRRQKSEVRTPERRIANAKPEIAATRTLQASTGPLLPTPNRALPADPLEAPAPSAP